MNKPRDGFYMEDVRSVALDAYATLTKSLGSRGVILTVDESEDIYCTIKDKLEEFSNGEYRHHN